ncbi:MAG: hypothetical protein U0L08_04875, partial [Bacteroidales bacterium]|nr:hypothetical protein [Bacteroidales bacterium]
YTKRLPQVVWPLSAKDFAAFNLTKIKQRIVATDLDFVATILCFRNSDSRIRISLSESLTFALDSSF